MCRGALRLYSAQGNAGFGDVKTKFPTCKKDKFVLGKCVERRNEPCHIVQIYEVLAAHHPAAQEGQFMQRLYQNTVNVFFPFTDKSTDK